jgi:hypothetical protein
MDGTEFAPILAHILHGGVEAIVTLLLAIIAYLLYERKDLTASIKSSHKEVLEAKEAEKKVILEILDKYHQGNISIAQAMNEIKIVLATLQGRLNGN